MHSTLGLCVLGSNLGRVNSYPEQEFSWYFSLSLMGLRDWTFKYTTILTYPSFIPRSLPTHRSFSYSELIRHCI
jgi:hypothetical protein